MKKILIIHTAFIGDIILSTPLIKKLKAKYIDQGCSITYVTTPAGASVLKNNPDLDEIIAYDKRGAHKGFKGLYLLGKRLNYKGFDEVIIPHRYLRSSILGRLTGAPTRVGYDNASGGFLLTKKIPYDRSRHEVEKLLSFVESDDFTDDKLSLYPGEVEKEKVDEIWKNNNLNDKKIKHISQIQIKTIHDYRNWRLNERHYGALQGLNKAETAEKYGDEQVKIWRRSYSTQPPALEKTDERYPGSDPRYADLTESELPLTECLKDTVERFLPYWHEIIAPTIKDGKSVLISAHGNSLRALVKYLDNVSEDEILKLKIDSYSSLFILFALFID